MPEHDIKRKASELLQKGRFEEAIREYQALLEQSKRPNPAIVNLIGDIYVKQGDHARGFSHFAKACKQYADEGLYHNGIAVGKKILRLDKDQTEVYRTLGDLYARQGLGMDAVKFLNEYARRKEEADEYPAALAAFAQACETISDCPEINVAYGEMLERMQRTDESAASFRRAAEIYAVRGMTAQSEHWTNRARELGGGETATDTASGVWDMMSLRDLDGKRAEPPSRERTRRPGSGVHPRAEWGVFQPGENPSLPPPPPLPGQSRVPVGGLAPPGAHTPRPPVDGDDVPDSTLVLQPPFPGSPARPRPAPERAEPHPRTRRPGVVDPLSDGESSDERSFLDGLTLDLPEGAPRPHSRPQEDAEATPRGSSRTGQFGLSDLPGIIMPPSAGRRPGPRGPGDTREVFPRPEESSVMTGFSAPYPETEPVPPAAPPRREQAIVIGDDTELVREGGDVNEVINDFREATSQILGVDDHQAHYDLGTTYLEMELFEEAAAEFELAARGRAFALVSREMLGYCYLRQGHIERAVTEIHKGLALEDQEEHEKIGLYYNLGIACGVLGQEVEAIAAFRRVEAINPDFRDTRTRLARLAPRHP